jgi:formate dehydrogenase subunit gamma
MAERADTSTPHADAPPLAHGGDDPAFAAWLAAWLAERAACTGRAPAQTDLLPVLLAVQAHAGHIDDGQVRRIAHALNLSRADVHGVASFYPDLLRTGTSTHAASAAPACPLLDLCAAEACQARGANALLAATAGDPRVRPVYCLGNCACGPSARQGDRILAHVTVSDVQALLAAALAAAPGAPS